MAEGGQFSTTLMDGSEALFDHVCTDCKSSRGSKQEAIVNCRECRKLLCNLCVRYHNMYMKNHTLINVASTTQSKPTVPIVSPVPVGAKCHFHPDLDIEMHCGTHDMVYCCRCIAKEHRSCSDVKDVEEVEHNSDVSSLQSLVVDITRVSKQLHGTKLERSNHLKQLKQNRASLLDEIKALRKKFNKQLDALEQKILAELDNEERKLEKDISDDITTADALMVASDSTCATNEQLTSYSSKKDIFITEKLGRAVLADANKFLKKYNKLQLPLLRFDPNDVLCEAIEKQDGLGAISRYTIITIDDVPKLVWKTASALHKQTIINFENKCREKIRFSEDKSQIHLPVLDESLEDICKTLKWTIDELKLKEILDVPLTEDEVKKAEDVCMQIGEGCCIFDKTSKTAFICSDSFDELSKFKVQFDIKIGRKKLTARGNRSRDTVLIRSRSDFNRPT